MLASVFMLLANSMMA
uniref:Uncharacterized protein n=1 Tax=Amphimedon queenslandica TaxID=400682 RepID=A0A1X7T278_AMPQE